MRSFSTLTQGYKILELQLRNQQQGRLLLQHIISSLGQLMTLLHLLLLLRDLTHEAVPQQNTPALVTVTQNKCNAAQTPQLRSK